MTLSVDAASNDLNTAQAVARATLACLHAAKALAAVSIEWNNETAYAVYEAEVDAYETTRDLILALPAAARSIVDSKDAARHAADPFVFSHEPVNPLEAFKLYIERSTETLTFALETLTTLDAYQPRQAA